MAAWAWTWNLLIKAAILQPLMGSPFHIVINTFLFGSTVVTSSDISCLTTAGKVDDRVTGRCFTTGVNVTTLLATFPTADDTITFPVHLSAPVRVLSGEVVPAAWAWQYSSGLSPETVTPSGDRSVFSTTSPCKVRHARFFSSFDICCTRATVCSNWKHKNNQCYQWSYEHHIKEKHISVLQWLIPVVYNGNSTYTKEGCSIQPHCNSSDL